MKRKLKNLAQTIKFLWRALHPILRAMIIIFAVICLLILTLSPNRGFWALICGVLLLAATLSGFAVYLALKEIK